jgi:hypothetical protein
MHGMNIIGSTDHESHPHSRNYFRLPESPNAHSYTAHLNSHMMLSISQSMYMPTSIGCNAESTHSMQLQGSAISTSADDTRVQPSIPTSRYPAPCCLPLSVALNPSPAWFAADITGRKFPPNHAEHVRSDSPFSLAPGSKAAETPHDQPLCGARGLSRLSRCSSRSLGPIVHSSRACKPRHSALIACTQLPMLFVRDDKSCCWSSSQYTTRIFFPVNKRTNFLIP